MSPKCIAILTTGGTISGALRTGGGGAYQAGVLSASELLSSVSPGLENISLRIEEVAAIDSKDATPPFWSLLRRHTQAALDDPGVAGVVITHGTDTLEETAYFLHLTLRSEKPVVLTAAMRPADALSADGPGNLLHAISVANHCDSSGRGVVMVMNNRIFSARDVAKMDASNLDAMSGVGVGPLGFIYGKTPIWYHQVIRRHTTASELTDGFPWPRVEILYGYAGGYIETMLDGLIGAAEGRVNGLVYAGTGNGSMSGEVERKLFHYVQQGVAVVRSTRTGGVVLRDVAVDDSARGFIAANNLNPQKARVLLMLGLLQGADTASLQSFFDTY